MTRSRARCGGIPKSDPAFISRQPPEHARSRAAPPLLAPPETYWSALELALARYAPGPRARETESVYIASVFLFLHLPPSSLTFALFLLGTCVCVFFGALFKGIKGMFEFCVSSELLDLVMKSGGVSSGDKWGKWVGWKVWGIGY